MCDHGIYVAYSNWKGHQKPNIASKGSHLMLTMIQNSPCTQTTWDIAVKSDIDMDGMVQKKTPKAVRITIRKNSRKGQETNKI